MADNVMRVVIIGDDRAYQQALTRSTASTARFQKQVETMNVRTAAAGQAARGALSNTGGGGGFLFGSGAFVATAVLTAGLIKTTRAASDLNESLTKTQQIFKSSGRDVIEWSKTTATALGVSQQQALESASTFGNLFNTIGLGPAKASAMSESLVQLAADLASFNNASIDDTLLAIRSGLIGEAEPLRKYGVLLSETRVQQEAMAETGKKSAKALTDQEKALARYNIILKDTAPAQGDFERTSKGLANQSRILKANLSDLAANMGRVLLPAVSAIVEGINSLFDGFEKLNAIGGDSIAVAIDTSDIPGSIAELERLRQKLIDAGLGATFMADAISEALSRLDALQVSQRAPVQEGRAGGFTGGLQNEIAQRIAAAEAAAAKEATAAEKRASKNFTTHIKGLGLKLDKAALTKGLDNDIAVLKEIERAILRREAQVGKTFALEQELTTVRGQIASKIEQRAGDASQKTQDAADALAEAAAKDREAWEGALDAMELRLDIAKAQRGFQGDLNVLKKIEALILERIKVEGQTTELLRKLFENRQEQAATRRQLVNSKQFEALGLTAEGEQKTPGSGSLLRRAQTLQNQIKGTALDTNKTRTQLRNIVNVLKGQFGKAGKDVRQAILGMLNDIQGALAGGGSGTLPHTAFVKKGIDKLLEGLGLSSEQIKELRQRFAKDGPLGTERGTGGFNRQPRTGNRASSQEGHETKVSWHIYIDGQEVEARVTRRQQRKSERTAAQRRGANPGTRR